MLPNPSGSPYGPTLGPPNLYPGETAKFRPTNKADFSTPLKENNMDTPAHKELYDQGYEMRKKVVGEEYVAASLEKASSDFLRPLQQYATEAAWGTIWTRPGLELKTRSFLNLGMLTALGKWTELGTHVRGAVRNGASELEIRECLLQATAYCGMPAGMEAFRTADRVLAEMEAKGEFVREK
ncbi:4-carboxymuconolactone decarboxylase [Lachnellula hyalina]|uniref:4-carboxymuconolactone decarboxylase n=1 Tax=Lachnellula hyalina TaxID=1316788 RepID=A0A8H8TZ95_9HELO|nr:4-carboxymuconolactone decarboxylase [Lachnellula hyalina]TVY28059.1 4-carboxymuconolactone decarboxylase [Lachnellula hyalina]